MLSSWYFTHKTNFEKFESMTTIDRYHFFKKVVENKLVESEVIPVFNEMDSDKSGSIDFKEYKMARFIIEGNSNMKEIK